MVSPFILWWNNSEKLTFHSFVFSWFFVGFHPSFSRHGITRASSVLLICLNENVLFPLPFHFQCDTCDSKKTTSLLEGARYAYARGILFCILGFWSYCHSLVSTHSIFLLLHFPHSSAFSFTSAFTWNTLQCRFCKLYIALLSVLKKVCHFSAIFSLFEAISTHILIGDVVIMCSVSVSNARSCWGAFIARNGTRNQGKGIRSQMQRGMARHNIINTR